MESNMIVGERMRSKAELAWARNRPFPCRPPVPSMGDKVWYRSNEFFVELTLATVVAVLDYDLADPNLWEVNDNDSLFATGVHPVADPWPIVILDIGKRYQVETREARLDGSAGWLPFDWERYWRPNHDARPGIPGMES